MCWLWSCLRCWLVRLYLRVLQAIITVMAVIITVITAVRLGSITRRGPVWLPGLSVCLLFPGIYRHIGINLAKTDRIDKIHSPERQCKQYWRWKTGASFVV